MVLPPPALASADPAPALSRGLSLLRWLGSHGAASLERLAGETGWPKSSVARLLASLEAAGAVWRDPASKRYHARLHLVAAGHNEEHLIAAWRRLADALATQSGQTVELFRFDQHGLVMIDRVEPEHAAVTAKARIGFAREMDEFDALTQTALAFASSAVIKQTDGYWAWLDGRKAAVAATRRKAILGDVQLQRVACDLGVNSNGIFRYAAPITDASGLRAVLAIAQVCLHNANPRNPPRNPPEPRLIELAHAAGLELSHSLAR